MHPIENPTHNPQPPTPAEGVALFYHPASLGHDTGRHPESAERLRAILAALRAYGISESELLRPGVADLDLVEEVHDPRYVAALRQVAESGGGYWDLDTYVSPRSYEAAIFGAGAAVEAVDAAMSGARVGFALVRPPGHHALYDSAMGFCLLNNVAIAARHATRKYGLERVLIVDWDVHHGNGTQDLFYTRPEALFFSTHQYPFYPGTGAIGETGEGEGRGYTVNVPLPAGVGDGGYKEVFNEVLTPVARRYKPQLILISAGYDAHVADPIGGMAVTVAGFSQLAATVRRLAAELCAGRVAAVLEGGYNIEAFAASVLATVAALGASEDSQQEVGETTQPSANTTRGAPDVSRIIAQVRQAHGLGA